MSGFFDTRLPAVTDMGYSPKKKRDEVNFVNFMAPGRDCTMLAFVGKRTIGVCSSQLHTAFLQGTATTCKSSAPS
jgi:hypothetical protein